MGQELARRRGAYNFWGRPLAPSGTLQALCALSSLMRSLWPTRRPFIPCLRLIAHADRPLRLLTLQVTNYNVPDV